MHAKITKNTHITSPSSSQFSANVQYRNGLLSMQYVFLMRSRAGCKKYVTMRSRVTYFLQPARERIKTRIAWEGDRFYFYC